MKSQKILYIKSNKKFCVYLYIHTHIHIYTHIHTHIQFIHIYIYTYTHNIQTYVHTCTHIHRHNIHIHITHACIHTYISIHSQVHTCAHDSAHMHAIKMQLKFLTYVSKSTCEQPHASHRHTCLRAPIYSHMYMYVLPISHICILSVVMSQLRICLQVTINSFLPGYRSTQKQGK